LRQQLTFPDPIALFYIQMGDLSEGIGADIDVSLRLDLARGAHDGRKILPFSFAGLDRDHALVTLVYGNAEHDQSGRDPNHADQHLLPSLHASLPAPRNTGVRRWLKSAEPSHSEHSRCELAARSQIRVPGCESSGNRCESEHRPEGSPGMPEVNPEL